jgi:alpha-tubulin suppressor-like RCC1 family protein
MKRSFAFLGALVVAACGARTSLPVDEPSVGGGGGEGGAGASGGAGGLGGAGGAGGVVELALGAEHSCLRTLEGRVYCWGGNDDGQIGQPEGTVLSTTPRAVSLPGKAASIAAGTYHTCATLLDGSVYCWGKNGDGQLGHVGPDAFAPEAVPLGAGSTVALALGEAHTCVTRASGSAAPVTYCFGRNASGQLGTPSGGAPVPTPTPIPGQYRALAAGDFWTLAIGNDSGLLWGWGDNASWQLGFDGPGSDAPTVAPFGVDGVRSGKGQHACGVTPGPSGGGVVLCWGNDTSGQLGRGSPSERELPGLVQALPGYPTQVAPGYDHTCALASGKVYCWGSNIDGKLGAGIKSQLSAIPVEVSGLDAVVAVASGTLHSCAFVSPTEIYCWGANDFGQLGNGDADLKPSYTPSPVVLP